MTHAAESGSTVVRSVECGRADGSTFIVEFPEGAKVVTTFEDPPEEACAPGEPRPDVIVYCKSVWVHETVEVAS